MLFHHLYSKHDQVSILGCYPDFRRYSVPYSRGIYLIFGYVWCLFCMSKHYDYTLYVDTSIRNKKNLMNTGISCISCSCLQCIIAKWLFFTSVYSIECIDDAASASLLRRFLDEQPVGLSCKRQARREADLKKHLVDTLIFQDFQLWSFKSVQHASLSHLDS